MDATTAVLFKCLWADILAYNVSTEVSQIWAAELKTTDSGCMHWRVFEDRCHELEDCVNEAANRLILHPRIQPGTANAEARQGLFSEPTAIQLIFEVALTVVRECDSPVDVKSIKAALPEFDPDDAALIMARLEREIVILSGDDDRYTEPIEKAFLRSQHVLDCSKDLFKVRLAKAGVRVHPEDDDTPKHSIRLDRDSLVNTRIYNDSDRAALLQLWKQEREKKQH